MQLPPKIVDATVTITFPLTFLEGSPPAPVTYSSGVYAGYCTVADVEFEFANLQNFSKLTTSIVAQEIVSAALEIQALLGTVYQMPYTGADQQFLGHLRLINAKWAASQVLDRYYGANSPGMSELAVELNDWAQTNLTSIINGTVQYLPPFGDAVPLGDHVQYTQAQGATITPNPASGDVFAQTPIFRIGRTHFRNDLI